MKEIKTKLINKKKTSKKGFTLIELLAVIVILALLLLLVSPKILGILDVSKKKNCLNNLKSIEHIIELDFLKNNPEGISKYILSSEGKGSIKDKNNNILKHSGKIIIDGTLEYDFEEVKKIIDGKCNGWDINNLDGGGYEIAGITNSNPNSPSDNSLDCFEFNEGTNTIESYYTHQGNDDSRKECPKEIKIPEEINSKEVLNIADNAFKNKGITSVEVSKNLTSIGHSAFRNNKIKTLKFNSSGKLQNVGSQSFQNNLIEKLSLPNSIKTIENRGV